jgi:hypothetical protein
VALNITEGFGRAAQSLGQWGQTQAQREMEAMKDARTENLARMSFGWKAQHDVNMADRSEAHDERLQTKSLATQVQIEKGRDESETRREAANIKLQSQSQQAYMDRMYQAQKADRDREQAKLDAQQESQRRSQIMQNRQQLMQATKEADQEKFRLNEQLTKAVQANPALAFIQDPQKKFAAMAADPTVGPILDQLHATDTNRSKTIAQYTLQGASLGDPMFAGKQDSEIGVPTDTGGSDGGADPNFKPPADYGLPTSGAPNPSDNLPALPAGSNGRATLMPPTVGPAPTPITSLVGPLSQPAVPPSQPAGPQLIPYSQVYARQNLAHAGYSAPPMQPPPPPAAAPPPQPSRQATVHGGTWGAAPPVMPGQQQQPQLIPSG